MFTSNLKRTNHEIYCKKGRHIHETQILTFEEHEVLEHVHQLRHLTEDQNSVACHAQLRQDPVQQLELS